jgi:hypothetical protein
MPYGSRPIAGRQMPNVLRRPGHALRRLSVLIGVLAAAVLLVHRCAGPGARVRAFPLRRAVFAGPPVYRRTMRRHPSMRPPQTFYYPPPASAEPATDGPTASGPSGGDGYCREYQTTARINGVMQPTYGTACLQPDGTWRIVN